MKSSSGMAYLCLRYSCSSFLILSFSCNYNTIINCIIALIIIYLIINNIFWVLVEYWICSTCERYKFPQHLVWVYIGGCGFLHPVSILQNSLKINCALMSHKILKRETQEECMHVCVHVKEKSRLGPNIQE